MFRGLPTASLRLADVFSEPFRFTIPAYQRPYSWSKSEAGQLLEDIIEASGVENPDTREEDYFLGSILLLDVLGGEIPSGEKQLPPRPFEIVDGQQRAATVTVLFAVLRDLEDDAESKTAKQLDALVAANGAQGGTSTPRSHRLTLRGPHQGFFLDYVQRPGACGEMPDEDNLGETEQLLFDVREHFLEELSALDADARRNLAHYLVENCHVVVMLTRDIDRAHRMFIVLNGRGKPLGRQDILKAEVLRDVPDATKEKAIAEWDAVAERLGGANFETFFSHLRVIQGHGTKPVISGVRDAIASSGGAQKFLASVFEPLSRAYDHVLRAPRTQAPFAEEIRGSLVYLGRLNGAEWVPSAMQTMVQYAEQPQRAAEVLREIDRFAHLQRLLCRGSGKRVRAFADVIEAIKSGRDLNASDSPTVLSPEDTRALAFNLRDLHGRNQQACKLVLLRLNDLMAGQLTEVDLADYSVEHVAPQRPRAMGAWVKGFPDPREREDCVKCLGNLTLIGPKQNERAKNQEFKRKKAIYEDGKPEAILRITHEVIALPDWTADIVRRRERQFLKLLDDLWRTGIEPRGEPNAGTGKPDNPIRQKRTRDRQKDQ